MRMTKRTMTRMTKRMIMGWRRTRKMANSFLGLAMVSSASLLTRLDSAWLVDADRRPSIFFFPSGLFLGHVGLALATGWSRRCYQNPSSTCVFPSSSSSTSSFLVCVAGDSATQSDPLVSFGWSFARCWWFGCCSWSAWGTVAVVGESSECWEFAGEVGA